MTSAGSTRLAFLQFLVNRSAILAESMVRLNAESRNFREAAAEIALRHGLVDPGQMDLVLTHSAGEDFVTAAMSAELIDAACGARLRMLHGLRELIEVGEALVLDGHLSAQEYVRELAGFLTSAEQFQNSDEQVASEGSR